MEHNLYSEEVVRDAFKAGVKLKWKGMLVKHTEIEEGIKNFFKSLNKTSKKL